MRWSWVLAGLLAGSGCYPMTVSAECQKQIDRCLSLCPPRESDPTVDRSENWNDRRSQCEKNCQENTC